MAWYRNIYGCQQIAFAFCGNYTAAFNAQHSPVWCARCNFEFHWLATKSWNLNGCTKYCLSKSYWHGYAQVVVEKAIKLGMAIKINSKDIKPISSKEYPMPAPRPSNSRLDTTKVSTVFSVSLHKWQDEVEKVIQELVKAKINAES